jgi:hypothetical protein
MKILAGLTRLFEGSRASDRTICEAYAHNSQLQLETSDLGHCAVYEKELQRFWPTTEENRKAKIASLRRNTDFVWHVTSRGIARFSWKIPPGTTLELARIARVLVRFPKHCGMGAAPDIRHNLGAAIVANPESPSYFATS